MVDIKVKELREVRGRLRFLLGIRAACSATTAAPVVSPLSTPPVGTPGAVAHGGNSTLARALVAGLGKSERCGEPKGAK